MRVTVDWSCRAGGLCKLVTERVEGWVRDVATKSALRALVIRCEKCGQEHTIRTNVRLQK